MKRIVFYLLLLCVISQGDALAGDDDLLAKIGDKKITVRDFDLFISSYPPDKQKHLSENPQDKVTLLNRMAHVTALADLARAQGLDKNEGIKMQIEYYADEILAAELMNVESNKIEVTENDMKLYYKMHEEDFRLPEMVKARHILVAVDREATDYDRKKARDKAEDILKRIKAGEDFGQLASEFSDDAASKSKGGDLGFIPRGKLIKSFEETAFSLKPGEVSDVLETKYGYHIIKMEEKKEAGLSAFDQARDQVRERVFQYMKNGMSKNLLERAVKEGQVEIHPELLAGDKK